MSKSDKESPSAAEQFAAMVSDATRCEESPFAKAMAEIGNPDVVPSRRPWHTGGAAADSGEERAQREPDAGGGTADREPPEWARLSAARDVLTITEAAIILAGHDPEEPLFSWQEREARSYAVMLQQATLLHKIYVLNAVDEDGEYVWLSHDHIRQWCKEKGLHWPLPEPDIGGSPVTVIGGSARTNGAIAVDLRTRDEPEAPEQRGAWPPRDFATTKRITEAFPHPQTVAAERWASGKFLSDCPQWAVTARVSAGKRGVSALWNPAQFALCMVSERHIGKGQAGSIIRREFPEWLDEWERLVDLAD